MDRASILERLTAEAHDLRLRFGVSHLAVFGSMARGDEHEDSDVDLYVTFEGGADFDRFMGLKLYLEESFDRAVDLLTPRSLQGKPEMQAEVERDLIHVS